MDIPRSANDVTCRSTILVPLNTRIIPSEFQLACKIQIHLDTYFSLYTKEKPVLESCILEWRKYIVFPQFYATRTLNYRQHFVKNSIPYYMIPSLYCHPRVTIRQQASCTKILYSLDILPNSFLSQFLLFFDRIISSLNTSLGQQFFLSVKRKIIPHG